MLALTLPPNPTKLSHLPALTTNAQLWTTVCLFAAIGTGGFSRIDAQASLSLCKGAVWHARETGTGIHFAPSHLRPEWPPDTLHKLHQRRLRLEIGDGGGSQM